MGTCKAVHNFWGEYRLSEIPCLPDFRELCIFFRSLHVRGSLPIFGPPPTLGGQQHLESLAHASHEVGRRCLGLLQTSIGLCLGTFPLLRIRHNTLLTRLARHGLRRTRRRLHCLLEVEDDRHWQGSLVCSRYAARTASVGPACGSGRRRWWLTTTRWTNRWPYQLRLESLELNQNWIKWDNDMFTSEWALNFKGHQLWNSCPLQPDMKLGPWGHQESQSLQNHCKFSMGLSLKQTYADDGEEAVADNWVRGPEKVMSVF
jgi:hypothetical protein